MNTTTPTYAAAVCIGRFQGLHLGQLAVIHRALALAPRVVIVIGSAHQARTAKNPFTWAERVEMVRLALTADEKARVRFVAVRDYFDSQRWVNAVRDGVQAQVGALPPGQTVLVGHHKDATSTYLDDFPGWMFDDVGSQGELHSSAVRDALFSAAGHPLEPALAALVSQVPPSTIHFLRAWAQLPCYRELAGEWASLRAEKAQWASAPYAPVFVTVDALIQCADRVLLIVRGRAPGQGLYALPGGFLEQRETVYQSALRELQEETGLHLLPGDIAHALKGVRVFDHPDRSARGRVITHAHYFDLGARPLPEVQGSDDARSAQWVPMADLAAMEDRFHDDHFHILDSFLGLTH
ncbi:bifunctional nicotinamide-nucleotide adenylyltransferase/Nudix hydroxylase [Hydrogenophaga sp. RWCD_12]|uniref:bifunctional nicotinamide-nucleotide adenylyltransferase/Nudix hydroxylase n=1 Tax=Hydrogenophaga sp. RWCD_12 TaxID=3391190 RepID=UPI003984BC02